MRALFILIPVSSACSEYEFAGKTEAVEGDAPQAKIEVEPERIDFGAQELGADGTTAEVVVVRNIGTADLLVEDVLLSESEGAFDISVLSGVTLSPEDETTFVVTWTPGEVGLENGQAHVHSEDPDRPIVAVELVAEVTETTDTAAPAEPDIVLNPVNHDFGSVEIGSSASVIMDIHNAGASDLIVEGASYSSSSGDLQFHPDHASNGVFPWVIEPGGTIQTTVDYAPSDTTADTATLSIASNDPDSPEASAFQRGETRPFEGFSTGWYIYDDAIHYETTSSSSHVVDHHGDHDLYWYEVSGAHGLVDSTDPEGDFEILRDYVIAMAGGPSVISGPLTFSSSSTLATFEYATFTYVLCDFWIEPGDDPARYEVSASSVDDGIQVMVNATILGHMGLGESPTSWSLASVGRPGEVNTLVVILADDSRSARYLTDLAFYKDGVMVE